MSPLSAQVASTDNARLKALEPLLDGLRQRWRSSPDPLEVPEIRVGPRLLEMSTWEWSQVGVWLQDPTKDDDRPACLVSQGIALQVKILNDLERLDAVQSEEPGSGFAIRGELMLDTAIGRSLVRKIQNAINQLLSAGDMKAVQEMTPFLHRLRNTTFEIRSMLQGSEQQQADALVDAIDAPREAKPSSLRSAAARPKPRVRDKSGRRPPQATAPRRARRAEKDNRPETRKPRTAILAVALLVAVVVRLGMLGLAGGAPVAPAGEAPGGLGSLGEVSQRWPSAFATVRARDWKGLDDSEKLDAIRATVSGLSGAGYTGLFVETDAGEPVGRWLRISGAELIDGGLESSPPGVATADGRI